MRAEVILKAGILSTIIEEVSALDMSFLKGQSNRQGIHFIHPLCVFPGNQTHNSGVVSTLR